MIEGFNKKCNQRIMLYTWMADINLRISACVAAGLMVIFVMPFSQAYTDERDVYAINSLYVALGSPLLPGWIPNGGDPCVEVWQGVQCVNSNITGIVLNGANLGGQLGDELGNFTSIITIDLSNNNIGGGIPENLPVTMQRFFLSANQFTGSIPSSLSMLTLLTDMSVNNNHLTGDLPDAFQSLAGLINLDLSFNNLTGQLPSSMENLSSLTTLHVQNNQLSGTLDVLEELPLKDLYIPHYNPTPIHHHHHHCRHLHHENTHPHTSPLPPHYLKKKEKKKHWFFCHYLKRWKWSRQLNYFE